jgi:hypothetical protein
VTTRGRVSLERKERKEARKRTLTVGAEKRNPCLANHEREKRDEAVRTVEEM